MILMGSAAAMMPPLHQPEEMPSSAQLRVVAMIVMSHGTNWGIGHVPQILHQLKA
jgi:hypothetical protein